MNFCNGSGVLHAADQAVRRLELERIEKENNENNLRQIIKDELEKFFNTKEKENE